MTEISHPIDSNILPVDLEKAYRLINHGPTVLVSTTHAGTSNVMAAAWACALDYSPPKVTVVLDKTARTRALVERSGVFALQVPTVAQVGLMHELGTRSLNDDPLKLVTSGVEFFHVDGFSPPLVKGCSAWLVCRLLREPRNQDTYDLFIGEVVGAWADARVFSEGHWHYEDADATWRSLHYIAGGHFYAIGKAVTVARDEEPR